MVNKKPFKSGKFIRSKAQRVGVNSVCSESIDSLNEIKGSDQEQNKGFRKPKFCFGREVNRRILFFNPGKVVREKYLGNMRKRRE